MTNREIAKTHDHFIKLCKEANCKPTARQASKWVNGKGIAHKVSMKEAKPLEPNQAGYWVKPAEEVSDEN